MVSGELMSTFFEYDPVTGIRTDLKWSEHEQEMTVIRTADSQALLDYCHEMRADGDISRRGIKESWWLYAKIPPIVELELRAKGINIHDRNDQARMFEEINTNYPHLKTSTGMHGGKVKKVV